MCSSTSCTHRHHRDTNRRKRRNGSRSQQPRKGTFLLYFLIYLIICEEIADVLATRDFYETLGVARDADSATIKKAYRKLAVKYHPDKNMGDKTAEKMYVELNNAYEVLSDNSKRRHYDMTGGESGGESDPFHDMFDFGRRRNRHQEERRVADVVLPITVDLELLYNGGLIDVAHRRQVLCDSWSDCESQCSQCGGQGIVIQMRRLAPGFVQQVQMACPKCGGTGKIAVDDCKSCPNGQFEKEEKMLTVDIARGMMDRHRITFDGQTDELPDHVTGSVHFELHTRQHKRFVRDGDDLHVEQHITLSEALIGVNRTVKQLDGRDVRIVTDKVISPDEEIHIEGEGMPSYEDGGDAGDMVVKFWVDFPDKITEEQKELVVKLLGKYEAKTGAEDAKDEL